MKNKKILNKTKKYKDWDKCQKEKNVLKNMIIIKYI